MEGVEYFFAAFVYACCSAIILQYSQMNASSLLCDLIWHHPCRLRPWTQKEVMLVLWRVFLFSWWEFDLPQGSGREHCTENEALFWLPLLQSIICNQSLGRIEEVRQPDQYTHFHNKHAEYVWERSSMQHLFPFFISLLNHTFDAVPWHRSHILRKWLDLEVRYVRYSEKSSNLNTHSFTVAETSRIDCRKLHHFFISSHSRHVIMKHSWRSRRA